MLDPGDGRITKSSLLARDTLKRELDPSFPLRYVVLVCARHRDLPGDVMFQNNLLNLLLY